MPINPNKGDNPFGVTLNDFKTESYLPSPQRGGEIPATASRSVEWFKTQHDAQNVPDVFTIGGHHVISEGYENSDEELYIFEPTLMRAVKNNAYVNAYFSHVKLAILWGCNTLTNLEPRDTKENLLIPEEIKRNYYGSADGRNKKCFKFVRVLSKSSIN